MFYDARPWLKSYDPGIEENIQIPEATLDHCFVQSFKAYSGRTALHYIDMSMTFGELLELSGRFAAGLGIYGFLKGDIITICLPNIPQQFIAMVGALRAGLAVCGLSSLLTTNEMIRQLKDSGAKALVTTDSVFTEKLSGVFHRLPDIKSVLTANASDCLSNLKGYKRGAKTIGGQVISFMDFIKQFDDDPPSDVCRKEDTCFVQYTGGTTGVPKGTILTHGNMMAGIHQYVRWTHIEHGKEVFLSAFPMFHIAGVFGAAWSLATGATQILIPEPRDTAHIITQMKRHQPTCCTNVPLLYMLLLDEEEFRKLDFSRLRFCASGGAPLPVDKLRALERVVGENKVVELYGMTEAGPLITVNPLQGAKKIGSVGLPLPNTQVRIVDLDDRETRVPVGERGELICRGPQVMKGYYNMPEETNKALREHDGAMWLHTGDVAVMDDDGYFYIVDRAKDMIIVGGYKIFSYEVEDKLHEHPAIGQCALVGTPDADKPGNEIVKLVVQKSEAYRDKPDEDVQSELCRFARKKLAPYKVPKIYEFVEAIPTTAAGKIDKKMLRQGRPGIQ